MAETTYPPATLGRIWRLKVNFFGFVVVLETMRTGAMRVVHIPVKTEETQRLRIKFVLNCPICGFQLENQTS